VRRAPRLEVLGDAGDHRRVPFGEGGEVEACECGLIRAGGLLLQGMTDGEAFDGQDDQPRLVQRYVAGHQRARTSGVEIYGAAKGLSPAAMGEVYGQIVRWAQAGELTFDLEKVPLSEIETAWQRTDLRGGRLVAMP
jgi:hypothetical protein